MKLCGVFSFSSAALTVAGSVCQFCESRFSGSGSPELRSSCFDPMRENIVPRSVLPVVRRRAKRVLGKRYLFCTIAAGNCQNGYWVNGICSVNRAGNLKIFVCSICEKLKKAETFGAALVQGSRDFHCKIAPTWCRACKL